MKNGKGTNTSFVEDVIKSMAMQQKKQSLFVLCQNRENTHAV